MGPQLINSLLTFIYSFIFNSLSSSKGINYMKRTFPSTNISTSTESLWLTLELQRMSLICLRHIDNLLGVYQGHTPRVYLPPTNHVSNWDSDSFLVLNVIDCDIRHLYIPSNFNESQKRQTAYVTGVEAP